MATPSALDHLDTPASKATHILIIGAGITGLVLAQALKKNGINFTVFERDPHVSARGRGWGLTIHWSLDTFISLLPQSIVDKLPETYVDPEASQRGENGNFLFFDLRTGDTRWKVPPSKRIRVSRERLRALLLEGLDVEVPRLHLHTRLLWACRLMTGYVVLHSGLGLLTQSPLPPQTRSLLISPMAHQQQVLYSSVPTAPDQECDRCYFKTTHGSRRTMNCPCGCLVPASSTHVNSPWR